MVPVVCVGHVCATRVCRHGKSGHVSAVSWQCYIVFCYLCSVREYKRASEERLNEIRALGACIEHAHTRRLAQYASVRVRRSVELVIIEIAVV